MAYVKQLTNVLYKQPGVHKQLCFTAQWGLYPLCGLTSSRLVCVHLPLIPTLRLSYHQTFYYSGFACFETHKPYNSSLKWVSPLFIISCGIEPQELVQHLSTKVCSESLQIFKICTTFHIRNLLHFPITKNTRLYHYIVYTQDLSSLICRHKNPHTFSIVTSPVLRYPHFLNRSFCTTSIHFLSISNASELVLVQLKRIVYLIRSINVFLALHVTDGETFNQQRSFWPFFILSMPSIRISLVVTNPCKGPLFVSPFTMLSSASSPYDRRSNIPTRLGYNACRWLQYGKATITQSEELTGLFLRLIHLQCGILKTCCSF